MCKQDPCQCCNKYDCKSWALLILRIALGVVFVYHGYGKLFGENPGMEKFIGMLTMMKFPLPMVFGYLAALSEFVGGIAILLGVWTRVFGSLIAVVMAVAIIFAKKFAYPAIEIDLGLLAIAVSLVLMGPGKYSVAAKLKPSSFDVMGCAHGCKGECEGMKK